MPTLHVNLTEDLNRFIAEKVESGCYADASEVVSEALRCLERANRSDEEKIAALRAAIEAGFASGRAREGKTQSAAAREMRLMAEYRLSSLAESDYDDIAVYTIEPGARPDT